MLSMKTLVMFLVVVAVTAGTYFALDLTIDRSADAGTDTGVTAEEVFGASGTATLKMAARSGPDMAPEEAAIRRIARATAEAAAAQTADEVARATVADQL